MFTQLANAVVFKLLHLPPEAPFTEALHFFVYDVSKILVLLFCIMTGMSLLRGWLDSAALRRAIERQPRPLAHLLAALFGAITPFCSCSSIALFIGFIEAGLPFGIAMTFLITSPMINEVAVLLLSSVLGWKVTLLYVGTGLTIGMLGGYAMEKLGFQRYLRPLEVKRPCCATKAAASQTQLPRSLPLRLQAALQEACGLFQKLWLFVILGVGIGAALHGYVPAEALSQWLSNENPFTVPLAVLVGTPLYADASSMVSIAEVLLQKGVSVGTVLVLMMSVVALSLPEMVILSRVMQRGLILRYLGFMALTFVGVGYLYNALL